MRSALPFINLAVLLPTSLLLLFSVGAGQANSFALILFPPWWSQVEISQATMALEVPILEFQVLGTGIIVAADGDTLERANAAGALIVLNAMAASLCDPELAKQQSEIVL